MTKNNVLMYATEEYFIARFPNCYGISMKSCGGLFRVVDEETLEEMFNEGLVDRKPNGTLKNGPPWDYWFTYSGKREAARLKYNL